MSQPNPAHSETRQRKHERRWYVRWWHQSDVFRLVAGKTAPKPGCEDWYAWFWEPHRITAWAYELVRRLPKCKTNLSKETLAILKTLPPYPELSLLQRECLRLALPTHLKTKPVALLNVAGTPVYEENYTKGWSLDLDANEIDRRKFLAALAKSEKKTGPSGKTSRNRKQLEKLGDMWQVEILDDPPDKARKRLRDLAISHAKKYLPMILAGWKFSMLGKNGGGLRPVLIELPTIPGLSGETFSEEELLAAMGKPPTAKSFTAPS